MSHFENKIEILRFQNTIWKKKSELYFENKVDMWRLNPSKTCLVSVSIIKTVLQNWFYVQGNYFCFST